MKARKMKMARSWSRLLDNASDLFWPMRRWLRTYRSFK